MFFKNLTVYRVPTEWAAQLAPLAETLPEHPMPEIAASALECRGWHPTVVSVDGIERFTMLRDFRSLPAGAVRRVADARIAELEQRQGFAAGRRVRRQILEEVAARLTPNVPVQRGETHAVLDRAAGWLLVDTSSPGRADDVTRTLRSLLGTLPAVPLAAGSIPNLMTIWLASGSAPFPFAFDDECQLVSRDELKATVRFTRHNLDDKGVVAHLRDGKLATSLALIWRDRIAFVLDERLSIRRLRFLDAQLIASNREEHEAHQAALADLSLMSGMLREFLADLVKLVEASDR